MGVIRKVVHIAAPPEAVWEVLCDGARLPVWNEELAAVKEIDGPLDHAGAGYTQVMRFGRWRAEGRLTVVSAEYARGREVMSVSPFTKYVRGRDRLDPRGGGTDLTVEIEYALRGGVFGKLLDALLVHRMMSRTFARNGANLKRMIEGDGVAADTSTGQPRA